MDIRFPQTSPKSVIGRAYEILASVRGGVVSDDESVSIPLVIAMMSSAYGMVLYEALARSANTLESIDPTLYMPYRIKLNRDGGGKLGSVAVKSSTLPLPAVSAGRPAIKQISGQDIGFAYAADRHSGVSMAEPKTFMGKRGAYWLDGSGKINLSVPVSMSGILYADVLMVPQNPFDIGQVDPWEQEIEIPQRLWENVKRLVRGDEMVSYIKTMPISDTTNDSSPVNAGQSTTPG